MVFRSWTHDRCCSAKLFFELVEYYKNNKLMQRSMVKLFLKMAMENKELDLIKQIQDQLHDYTLPSKGRTTAVSDSMLVVTSAITSYGVILPLNSRNVKYPGEKRVLFRARLPAADRQ